MLLPFRWLDATLCGGLRWLPLTSSLTMTDWIWRWTREWKWWKHFIDQMSGQNIRNDVVTITCNCRRFFELVDQFNQGLSAWGWWSLSAVCLWPCMEEVEVWLTLQFDRKSAIAEVLLNTLKWRTVKVFSSPLLFYVCRSCNSLEGSFKCIVFKIEDFL